MHLLHTALYALLGAAFVFAVIELGLTAYVESQYESYDSVYYSYGETIKISSPPIVGFLIFCSVWTMLVTGGALFSSWFFTRRGSIARSVSFIISIVHLLVYFMTMVFWLAGFADMAALLGGFYASDYANAIIAFAVLLWYAPHRDFDSSTHDCTGSSFSPCWSSISLPYWVSSPPTGRDILHTRNGLVLRSRIRRCRLPQPLPQHRSPLRNLRIL